MSAACKRRAPATFVLGRADACDRDNRAPRFQRRHSTGAILAVLLLCQLILLAPKSVAAPGDVDLSFNPGLRVNDFVYSSAVQPDGKVIIGGLFTSPGTLIARLNTNGSVDASFNAGAGANGIVYSIAVQTDGKIVLGGAFSSINGIARGRITRLNADGSLDTSFDPGTGADARIRAVVVQPNGKILIGGDFFEVNQTPRTRVARLNANGSVDMTFDPGTGADDEVYCIALQPNSQVLIGGYFGSVNDIPMPYIARLNANGGVDQNFGAETGADLDVDSIALQPDGKMIIGGGFNTIGGIPRNRIARLHGDGGLDESFDPGIGVDFHVGAVAVQPDGQILLGGNFGSVNGIPRGNIARLNTNGSVDDSFDPGDGSDAVVYSLCMHGGKTIIAGGFRIVNGETRNFVARLNANGSVDAGFNPSTGADYPVLSIAPEAGGKVLMGGYFTVINNTSRHYIARLNTDGVLDTSFNPGLGANNRVTSVVAEPDGKVLIGGLFTSFNGTNRGRIARLHANGSLDILFDPGAGANLTVRAVAAQVDGKVLIAGDFVTVNGTNRNSIARLNVNGSVDATFNPGTGANNPIESISLQPDGKLLVAGQFTSINGTNRNRIARLHADGSLDLSFSPGTGADGIVFSVAVQADGKVLLGGDFFSFAGASRTHIARLNTNGSLDATFNPTARANDTVSSVAVSADGKLFVGGFFNTVNGIGRSGIARLEGDAPLPALNISLANAILISWPIAFTNFTLQTTTNVAEPNSWADVPGMPAIVGDRLISTNTLDSANTFFRLKSLIDASVQR